MTPVDAWPLDVLTPKHPGFWPVGGSKRGPDAISQLQTFDNLAGGPIWQARYVDIPIYCTQRVLAAQAIQGLAMQGTAAFRVWRSAGVRSPAPADGGGVPFSDGASFSDGTLFAGVSMSATLASAAELYSAVVEIQVDGAQIQAGHEFTVYDPDARWRLHRILRVLETDGAVSTVEITPPLRFDAAAGLDVDFENLSCTMRMTNAATFLQILEWNKWADVTAEFEELMT